MTLPDLRPHARQTIRDLMAREKALAARLAVAPPEACAQLRAELVTIARLRNEVHDALVQYEAAS